MASSTVAHHGGTSPELPKTVERTHDLSCSTRVTLTALIILGLAGLAAGLLGAGLVGTSPVTRISRFVGGSLGSKVLAGAGGGTAFIALALLCCCTGRPSATVKNKPNAKPPQPASIPEGLTCKATQGNQLVISSADGDELHTLPIQDAADPFEPTLVRQGDDTLSINPADYGLAIQGFEQPISLTGDVREDGTLDVDSTVLQHLVAFVRLYQETAARFSLDASEDDGQQTLMDKRLGCAIAVWTDEASANASGYVNVSHVEGERVVQFNLGAILNLGGWTREGEESDTLSINVASKDELARELPELASRVRTRGFGFVNVTYVDSGERSTLVIFRLKDDGSIYYQKREAGTTAFHYLDITDPLKACEAAKADHPEPPEPAPEPQFTFVKTVAVTNPDESIRDGEMNPKLELNQFTVLRSADNTQTVFVMRMDAVPAGLKAPLREQYDWPGIFSIPIEDTGYTPQEMRDAKFSHLHFNRDANVVMYGSQRLLNVNAEQGLDNPASVGQLDDEVATSLGKTLFAQEMSKRSQGEGMPPSLLRLEEYERLEDAVAAMKTAQDDFAAKGLWAVAEIEGIGVTLIAAPPIPAEGQALDHNLRVINMNTSGRFTVSESDGKIFYHLDGQEVLHVKADNGVVSNGLFLAVVLEITDRPDLHEAFGVSLFKPEAPLGDAESEASGGSFGTPRATSPVAERTPAPQDGGPEAPAGYPGLFPNISDDEALQTVGEGGASAEDAGPAAEAGGQSSGQQAASQPGTPGGAAAPKQELQPATPAPGQATAAAHAAIPVPSAGNSGKAIVVKETEGHVVVTFDGVEVTIPITDKPETGAFYKKGESYLYVESNGTERTSKKPRNAEFIVKDFQEHQKATAKAIGLAKTTAGTLSDDGTKMTFKGEDGQSVTIPVAEKPTAGHVWVGKLGGSQIWWYGALSDDGKTIVSTACNNADMVIEAHGKFLESQKMDTVD